MNEEVLKDMLRIEYIKGFTHGANETDIKKVFRLAKEREQLESKYTKIEESDTFAKGKCKCGRRIDKYFCVNPRYSARADGIKYVYDGEDVLKAGCIFRCESCHKVIDGRWEKLK